MKTALLYLTLLGALTLDGFAVKKPEDGAPAPKGKKDTARRSVPKLPMGTPPKNAPNVLFIAVDDMRDWVGFLGDKQAKTPNFDRLAKMGEVFTHAYTASALCNPSRTALLTGERPGHTGVYGNGDDWRDMVPKDLLTIPGLFRTNGYRTVGAGKIFHGSLLRFEEWEDFVTDNEKERTESEKDDWRLVPGKTPDSFNIGTNLILPVDGPVEELVDWKTATYGVKELERPHDGPFFLACGFHRPHLPWQAPRKYFDMFPVEKIVPPPTKPDDLSDLPPEGVEFARAGEFAAIRDLGKLKECIRAYLACIAYIDDQVGRLLDALEKSPARDNTIIVFWSDHGWHFGEKEHWRKTTLWEEATRSALIWRVPGLTKPGSVCDRPVDFMSVYPTLCDVAGLPAPSHLQGLDVRPLLADAKAPWDHPAISTMKAGNHAVRTEDWRYIRYAGGGEELYDHRKDPHEWENLATHPEAAAMKAELAKFLPAENNGRSGSKLSDDQKAKIKELDPDKRDAARAEMKNLGKKKKSPEKKSAKTPAATPAPPSAVHTEPTP